MASKTLLLTFSTLLFACTAQAWSIPTRRDVLLRVASASTLATVHVFGTHKQVAQAKAGSGCTNIDSCREIGDARLAQEMTENPTTKLPSGVHYRILRPGISGDTPVSDDSVVELAYSISESNGRYLYSQGLGYEKVPLNGQKGGPMVSDLGQDSIIIHVGGKDVPVGIQQGLMGMRRGERRRISLPAAVGFDTSDWQPVPRTTRGALALQNYKNLIRGTGGMQLAYPAETVWDVEVLRIKGEHQA